MPRPSYGIASSTHRGIGSAGVRSGLGELYAELIAAVLRARKEVLRRTGERASSSVSALATTAYTRAGPPDLRVKASAPEDAGGGAVPHEPMAGWLHHFRNTL